MIRSMLRFRDVMQSRAAAPGATHVVIAATTGGEHATYIDAWKIKGDVLYGYYAGDLVVMMPLTVDWSLHTVDAIELVDAATVEAGILHTANDIMRRAGLTPPPMDDRPPF